MKKIISAVLATITALCLVSCSVSVGADASESKGILVSVGGEGRAALTIGATDVVIINAYKADDLSVVSGTSEFIFAAGANSGVINLSDTGNIRLIATVYSSASSILYTGYLDQAIDASTSSLGIAVSSYAPVSYTIAANTASAVNMTEKTSGSGTWGTIDTDGTTVIEKTINGLVYYGASGYFKPATGIMFNAKSCAPVAIGSAVGSLSAYITVPAVSTIKTPYAFVTINANSYSSSYGGVLSLVVDGNVWATTCILSATATDYYFFVPAGKDFKIISNSSSSPYVCVNSIAIDPMNGNMEEEEVPDTVSFTATPGPEKVTLSWTVPAADAYISAYVLKGNGTSIYVDPSLGTYTFNGLTGSTEYTFTIEAMGFYGDLSAASSQTATAGAAVSGPVTVTWDWVNSALTSIGTGQAAGSVASDVSGVALTVNTMVASSKLADNGTMAQFNSGAIISIPVSAGSVVTITAHSDPYALYSIVCDGVTTTAAGASGDATKTVTASSAGSVTVTSTGTAYLFNIVVTNYVK